MHQLLLIFILTIFNLSAFADNTHRFSLSTTSFQNNGTLPVDYSCDGKNISPALSWSNVPKNTKTFALILSDPDAPGGVFYHWVLYNIPSSTHSFPEGINKLPEGTITVENSWQKMQYNGPCPPHAATHHYFFKLYSLDTPLNLPANSNVKSLIKTMQTHIIDTPATLTVSFGH